MLEPKLIRLSAEFSVLPGRFADQDSSGRGRGGMES